MQHRASLRRIIFTAVSALAALFVSTGCAALGLDVSPTAEPTPRREGGGPYLVVTMGGAAAANPTLSVAETIPESTPLPRIQLPAPDPNATPRPAASPSVNLRGGSPAQRASRPPDNLAPPASPVAASP